MLDIFYEPFVEFLLRTKQYNLVIAILYDARKYNDSEYINKWLGQVSVVLNYLDEGIKYLETAYSKDPGDLQLVYNLTRAYYLNRQFEKGDFLIKKLSRVSEYKELTNQLRTLRKQLDRN